MKFEILHEIIYRYTSPVFFEPHTLYLRPREDPSQKLLGFDIALDPQPILNTWEIDSFGNQSYHAWFQGLTDHFTIRSRSEVEISRANPFDYLVETGCQKLPVRYRPEMKPILASYQLNGKHSPAAESFSEMIAERVDHQTVPFLLELAREIASEFKIVHRLDGDPWPSLKTLEKRTGACRDLSVLFMDCCRAQGLAARFTSGYYEGDPDKPEKELHAWCEVYLEGGGWRGFDPTAGLAVAETHIPVAAAHSSKMIAPVLGAFRGNDVSASMKTKVSIRRI